MIFSYYRKQDRHYTLFCYHCCKAVKSNKLKSHYRQLHGTEPRALRQNETPVNPIYMNRKELTRNYLNTKPIRDLSVRILHPTRSILAKRLHSSAQSDDNPSTEEATSNKSSCISSRNANENLQKKPIRKSLVNASLSCKQT